MKLKYIVGSLVLGIMVVITAHPTFSYAQSEGSSSTVGWGGDGIVMPDLSVVLADPFVKRSLDQKYVFSDELNNMLQVSRLLLTRMGASDEFFKQQVFGSYPEYLLVDELPSDACKRMQLSDDLPGEVVHIACTEGRVTKLLRKYIERLNLVELTKLIVHERLRSLDPPVSDVFLSDITSGLHIMLSLYQKQSHGEFGALSDDEKSGLHLLLRSMYLYAVESHSQKFVEKIYFDTHFVNLYGGGLVPLSQGPISMLGVGSVLLGVEKLHSTASIHLVASQVYGWFGANSVFNITNNINLPVQNIHIGNNSSVTGNVKYLGNLYVENNVVLDSCACEECSFRMNDNSVCINSTLLKPRKSKDIRRNTDVHFPYGASLVDSSVGHYSHLSKGSVIENVNIDLDILMGANASLKNATLNSNIVSLGLNRAAMYTALAGIFSSPALVWALAFEEGLIEIWDNEYFKFDIHIPKNTTIDAEGTYFNCNKLRVSNPSVIRSVKDLKRICK